MITCGFILQPSYKMTKVKKIIKKMPTKLAKWPQICAKKYLSRISSNLRTINSLSSCLTMMTPKLKRTPKKIKGRTTNRAKDRLPKI